jgi:TPR repeat protein
MEGMSSFPEEAQAECFLDAHDATTSAFKPSDTNDATPLTALSASVVTEDRCSPHAPITAGLFTYGLVCERFAVEPYANGHEIMGIDNLLATLRGISSVVSLSLKGLKPYVPFTHWIRVTDENKAFFEHKQYFPYLPAAILSSTAHFQLAYFFPSAFGVPQVPIYLAIIHNTSALGPVPVQYTEEFRPCNCSKAGMFTLSKPGEDFLGNLDGFNCQLGQIHQALVEEPPNPDLLKYLADFGVVGAILRYADWCESNGNDAAAVHCFTLAAEQEDAEAQFNLGFMYANAKGTAQDDVEAIKWYLKAAEQGHAVAQTNLGLMYAKGRAVTQDCVEALKWYRLAAGQGYPAAQLNLGYMYANGNGVAQDDMEAVTWYRMSAEQGYAAAQNQLGLMYENGKGVIQDDAEAAKWCRMAAEQGDAAAQYNLGLTYENGVGVAQDYVEAVKWYRLAAEQGLSAAQCTLGIMYSQAAGVAQSDTEAVNWFRVAAEQGDADAQYNLASRLADGIGGNKDVAEAVKWFSMAAAQGDADAQYDLGCKLADGIGVIQDVAEAKKWLRMAAAQGHSEAQFKLC